MRVRARGCGVIRIPRCVLSALLVGQTVCLTVSTTAISEIAPMIAPEVRQRVGASSARVSVELRLGDSGDPNQRPEAIARAQDALLSRLPHSHIAVARRYTSVPLLALEIGTTALAVLVSRPRLGVS